MQTPGWLPPRWPGSVIPHPYELSSHTNSASATVTSWVPGSILNLPCVPTRSVLTGTPEMPFYRCISRGGEGLYNLPKALPHY
jgi:hypothetical protein